jgi:hypothetical protein
MVVIMVSGLGWGNLIVDATLRARANEPNL